MCRSNRIVRQFIKVFEPYRMMLKILTKKKKKKKKREKRKKKKEQLPSQRFYKDQEST
jgi:hypothetical protein